MSTFSAVDLSKLPAPDIVEPLCFETILEARKARLKDLLKECLPDWGGVRESDPLVKILEEQSYRELILRQRVNDAARAVMLAKATGADLDQLAANFEVSRLTLDPGDPTARPPRAPIPEPDTRLRERAQLAFEGLSTAGPEGAYLYHALTADARVLDVKVTSPAPVDVVVTILSSETDGIASPELLDVVRAALRGTDDGVRPFTDRVTVQSAKRRDYAVSATLELYSGPDSDVVRDTALASITAFTMTQRRIGEPVTIDGLHKALRVEGVRRVTLTSPVASVETAKDEYPFCTRLDLSIANGSGVS